MKNRCLDNPEILASPCKPRRNAQITCVLQSYFIFSVTVPLIHCVVDLVLGGILVQHGEVLIEVVSLGIWSKWWSGGKQCGSANHIDHGILLQGGSINDHGCMWPWAPVVVKINFKFPDQ